MLSGLVDSIPILRECFFFAADAVDLNNFGFLSVNSCCGKSVSVVLERTVDLSLGGDPVCGSDCAS